jgi:hypothetical protein
MVVVKRPEKFVFSPSSLVDFENPNTCIPKWHSIWVDKSQKLMGTLSQKLGQYFESLCLGDSPYTDVPMLPKKRNGDPLVMELRAQEQAKKFHQLFDPRHEDFIGERIVDRHVKLTTNQYPKKRGIIDFISEDMEDGWLIINDLKFVNSLTSGYGYQPWDQPGNIDPIQLGTYKAAYKELHNRNVRTRYLVFENSPRLASAEITVNVTDEHLETIDERYKRAYSRFQEYESKDWTTDHEPTHENCNSCLAPCPLRHRLSVHESYDIEDS